MRQYFQITKAGSLKDLIYHEGPIPELTEGKVLVGVKAVGLNFADVFAITGLYSATPQGPFIPGLEFAGEVLETSSPLHKKGAKVMGLTRFGGYDSHIVADPNYLFPLPEGWSFEQGAAFPVQTLTAYYALKELGNIKTGQTVMIHSAAGGVGLQANRIAKKFDAYTIGMVGTKEKLKVLEEEGFDKGVVRGNNFKNDLKEALGDKELNLVLEATGGEYFQYSYDALAPMGRLVTYGSAQFTPTSDRPNYISLGWKYLFRPKIDPMEMVSANKSVMAFNLIWLYERGSLLKGLWDEINKLALPAPKIGHEFSFKEAHKALEFFKSGKTVGKVILKIDS